MTVLGFQLVLTIIVLSVLNKIAGKYSVARWLLARGSLIRYKHPTDQKLRDAISDLNRDENGKSVTQKSTSKKEKGSRKRNHQKSGETKSGGFLVPQNLPLELESEPVSILHLINLPYYTDLQWLIDFSFCTLLVYILTEGYYCAFPERASKELNLSVVWCLLSLLYSMKCLFTITGMIFRQKDERSLIISFFCGFFLLSMIVLIPNEDFLEFGLVDAYKSFNEKAIKLIEHTGSLDAAYGPISFLIFRFWLAIICGLLGSFFVYPGLRIGKMQIDALQYAEHSPIGKVLYHTSFISPLFVILLWIKPIARHYLTVRDWPNRGVLMSDDMFESVRLVFILFVIVLRFGLFRRYLQAFLNIAPQKLTIMKKDSAKITNLDLQKQIAGVTYYLCVAALQFLAPIFLILFATLLTKSIGNYCWTGGLLNNASILSFTGGEIAQQFSSLPLNPTATLAEESDSLLEPEFLVKAQEDNITAAIGEGNINQVRLNLFKDVFNSVVLRGLTGFGLWWTFVVWFFTSIIGYIYHNQFKPLL